MFQLKRGTNWTKKLLFRPTAQVQALDWLGGFPQNLYRENLHEPLRKTLTCHCYQMSSLSLKSLIKNNYVCNIFQYIIILTVLYCFQTRDLCPLLAFYLPLIYCPIVNLSSRINNSFCCGMVSWNLVIVIYFIYFQYIIIIIERTIRY